MPLLWFAFGLLGAIWILWHSQKNGYDFRSSLRWAMGTFFMPAIAIPLYFWLQSTVAGNRGSKNSRQEPRDITSDMGQSCRHCGKYYGGSPARCPHCKENLLD